MWAQQMDLIYLNTGKSINDTVGDPLSTFDKHLNGQKPNTF